jgi:DNA-binding transcriptional regulator YhcF (GntR family)
MSDPSPQTREKRIVVVSDLPIIGSPVGDFRLDFESGVPLYRQIVDQIRCSIAAERFLPGQQLPTVRDLAVRLRISPNTARKAYAGLTLNDIVEHLQGRRNHGIEEDDRASG